MTQKRTDVITLIIAVFACIAGYLALPQIQRELFSQPNETHGSLPTVLVIKTNKPPPTYTSYPSQISFQRTITPHFTYTAVPVVIETPTTAKVIDTVEGTILEIGQSWHVENLILTLGEVKLQTQPDWGFCYVSLRFFVENKTPFDRTITVKESQFTITDNLGRNNIPHSISSYTYPCPPPNGEPFSELVISGGRFPKTGYWYVGVSADITNTSLDYLIVTVNGLSSFNGATWKIPIYH